MVLSKIISLFLYEYYITNRYQITAVREGSSRSIKVQFYHNCYYEKINNNAPVKLEDLPFDIPDSWTWIRLKDLIHIQTGASFKKEQSIQEAKSGFVRVLRGGNILPFQFLLKNDDLYIPQELVSNDILLRKNDLITPAVTSLENIGKIAVITNDLINVTAGGFVYIFRPYINDEILSNLIADYVSSSAYQSMMKDITKKSGQAFYNMNKEKLLQLYFPIAPFAEMIRIVDKVKKCEPLIDEYSLIEEKLSILEEEFPEKLKKSILQYAIEGKLVKQNPNDEPASVLLERIKAEKERLIKEGKIKRDKNESYIYQGDDKNYYKNLPLNWSLLPLEKICKVVTCGYASTPKYEESGIPFISAKNVKPYNFLYKDYRFISEQLYRKIHVNYKPEKGDILLTRVGAGIGEACIIDVDHDFGIYVSVTLIKLVMNEMNNWILNLLQSPYGLSLSNNNTYGKDASQGNLNVNNVRQFLCPIPPLREQKRILNKLSCINCLLDY